MRRRSAAETVRVAPSNSLHLLPMQVVLVLALRLTFLLASALLLALLQFAGNLYHHLGMPISGNQLVDHLAKFVKPDVNGWIGDPTKPPLRQVVIAGVGIGKPDVALQRAFSVVRKRRHQLTRLLRMRNGTVVAQPAADTALSKVVTSAFKCGRTCNGFQAETAIALWQSGGCDAFGRFLSTPVWITSHSIKVLSFCSFSATGRLRDPEARVKRRPSLAKAIPRHPGCVTCHCL